MLRDSIIARDHADSWCSNLEKMGIPRRIHPLLLRARPKAQLLKWPRKQ